jgi:lipid II:glycine glycyltransferase (peptidoglycan interpeptide bridge formation enzyme)
MPIFQVTDDYKDHWDNFVQSNAFDGGLLQSWAWGDFQKDLDNKIYRLALVDDEGQFQAVSLLIKHELHFEYSYLYCPRGPVIDINGRTDLESLFAEIKKIAAAEKSFLLRVDPPWPAGNENLLSGVGLRKGDNEVQPKCSFILDISLSEDELLKQMKPKVRYNIGLAKKHGVNVRLSREISDIESFWQLTKQTSARDGFVPHPKEHYMKMFERLAPEGRACLFLAEYNKQIVAAHLLTYFGPTCCYLHGASADLHREVMAPYLLQWAAILDAKERGMSYYDFGGVNGKTYFNEKWEGITRFKTGFGPEVEPREYVGSFELVLNPVMYAVYKFIKQIRG